MFGFLRRRRRDTPQDAAVADLLALHAHAAALAQQPFDSSNPLYVQAVHDIEAYLGVDMDRDDTVAGEKLDAVTQLERVAALHAAGKLTGPEFQNLKGKILGG